MSDRGRGRPPVYVGHFAKQIASVIRKRGLRGAQVQLLKRGVSRRPGAKLEIVEISLPTLGRIAQDHGIELRRGRRAAA